MKASARTAAALGVGYMLGRQHKLRTAATLAAAAAFGSTPPGGLLLRRGGKMLGSATGLGKLPPEIAGIIDSVRGDLVPAGKAAVSAAATSRVDALTDALHERAELVRNPGEAVSDVAGEATRRTGDVAGEATRRTGGVAATGKRRAGGSDEDDDADREDVADEADEADAADEDEYDEEPGEGDEADEADQEPVTRVRRTATRRRAPVARARR